MPDYYATKVKPGAVRLSDINQSSAAEGDIARYANGTWAPDKASTAQYLAKNLGLLPGNSGATNTAALQSAINTISTAGGGEIIFDRGTYLFNHNGTNPFYGSNRYCIQFKSNVLIKGQGRGTVLKLADTQMSGNTNGVHLFTVGDACTNFGFQDLTLDGNAAGQSGWTAGYSQGNAYSLALSSEYIAGPDNIFNLYLKNLLIKNWFSTAMDINGCTGLIAENLEVENTGEGWQITDCKRAFCYGYTYRNPGNVSVGDGWESSGGSDIFLDNFLIEGCDGGSAIDIGTNGFRLTNGLIRDCGIGVVIQNRQTQANLENSNGIVSDIQMEDCSGIGFQVSGSDTAPNDCEVTFSNCRAYRCLRGFSIAQHASVSHLQGNVHLLNCVANGCTEQGLEVYRATVTVTGGDFSNNTEDGVLLNPSSNTARNECRYTISGSTIRNNGGFGINFNNATHAPYINIAAYLDGNAASKSNQDKDCQVKHFYWESATDISIRNLRSIRHNGTVVVVAAIAGESIVRVQTGPLVSLEGGTNGQVVTLYADTNNIWLYDESSTEAGVYGVTDNLVNWSQDNLLMYVGDSVTYQYRASTQKWYQIAGSKHRNIMDLIPLALAAEEYAMLIQLPSANATAYGWKVYGDRSMVRTEQRNTRSGGLVHHYQWSNGGDCQTDLYDGTNWYSYGLDQSDGKFKVSNGSGALGTGDCIATDASSTAGHTRFFLYDVDNGTLERVTVGAADSGGSGFKVLRIPN